MLLTIGFPTRNDASRLRMCVQVLRMYHARDQVEILVADNDPDAEGSRFLATQIKHQIKGVRYIPCPNADGPAAVKNYIFDNAFGDWVWCMDSHVFPGAGAVEAALRRIKDNPDSNDLIVGPNYQIGLDRISTHYTDKWSGGMRGVWSTAWEFNGKRFDVRKADDGLGCELHGLMGDAPPDFQVHWAGHEDALTKLGCRQLGLDPKDEFEVPAQGCGSFMAQRRTWLAFHRQWRGFGGEEFYIAEKYRAAGRRVLCVGDMPWWHDYDGGPKLNYTRAVQNTVRNVVLGNVDLRQSNDDARKHYVDEIKWMTPAEYDRLISDPFGFTVDAPPPPDAPDTPVQTLLETGSMKQVFNWAVDRSDFFNKHMPIIRDLASNCRTVIEITRFKETSIALAAGNPREMTTYVYGDQATDLVYGRLHRIVQDTLERPMTLTVNASPTFEKAMASLGAELAPCDLLLFKTPHDYHNLAEDLERWHTKVSRFIVLHDTYRNGLLLDDRSPGYIMQLKKFCQAHPEWFTRINTRQQCGLVVLAKQQIDRPSSFVYLYPPDPSVGAEFKAITDQIGVKMPPSCSCLGLMKFMDQMGVEGCVENRDKILDEMRKNLEKWKWKQQLDDAGEPVKDDKGNPVLEKKTRMELLIESASIGSRALKAGIIVDPRDPLPGMLELAIQRAKDMQATRAAAA
jgi:hypothetical protein